MRSTIAAFLMSIPLSAIGLMAIFGIPQMAPGSLFQREKDKDDEIVRGDYFDDEEESPRRRRSRLGADDNAAPAFGEEPASKASSRPDRFAANDSHADHDHSGEETRDRGAFARRDANDSDRVNPFGSSEAAPREKITEARTNLTWKAAKQRLAEMGVTHFHLEQGASEDSFLFVCMFSPGDDPRVTRRFEAEAPEPLAAVDGVLGQIDRWMQGRFASRTQAGLSLK